MKRLTAGIAREIVDTSKTAREAGYRPTDGFYGRNVQGATAIASPTQTAESFHLLNVIRKLVRDFARQSPKEPMPSAIVKVAHMRVVPDTYRRAMETQVDVDKFEPPNLEDEVLAFIRNNTSGAAPKDIGNIAPGQTPAPGLGSSSQSTPSSSHGGPRSEQLCIIMGTRLEHWRCRHIRKFRWRVVRFAERQREGQKWKFQQHLLQLWKVRSFGQVLLCKRWKSKRRGKEGRQQWLE